MFWWSTSMKLKKKKMLDSLRVYTLDHFFWRPKQFWVLDGSFAVLLSISSPVPWKSLQVRTLNPENESLSSNYTKTSEIKHLFAGPVCCTAAVTFGHPAVCSWGSTCLNLNVGTFLRILMCDSLSVSENSLVYLLKYCGCWPSLV